MTTTKQIGPTAIFAFAIGAGLLIGVGSLGVASASTGDGDQSPVSSVSVSATPSLGSTAGSSPARVLAGPVRRGGAVTAAATSLRRLTLTNPSALQVTISPVTKKVVAPRISTPAVSTPAIPTSPAPGDTIYGNLGNAKYWKDQSGNTCVLMSTAMVIGQLTGKMPSQAAIVAEAERTPSVFPNYKSYLDEVEGPNGLVTSVQRTRNGMIYKQVNDEYVYYADSLQILYNHNITATATYYTDAQSARALTDLEAALHENDSVIVSINSWVRNAMIWKPGAFTGGNSNANHAVTVLAVNVTKREVYINDTALDQVKGNYLTLSYDDFLKAWKPGRYTLITASLADPADPPTGPAQWQLVA